MCDRRLARCLMYLVLLLALTPGCQAMYHYRPLAVQTVDAETRKPIPGAEVLVSYPVTPASQAPRNSSGTTGNDGIAQVQAAPCGNDILLVTATASGYISEDKDLSAATVQAIKPAEKGPARCVVELYAAPRPNVELVLPNGYRGMLKVGIEFKEDAPHAPGQRDFSYVVAPEGTKIIAPPLLRHLRPEAFNARYANGKVLSGTFTDSRGDPLSKYEMDTALGFWWLKRDDHFEYYLVGTVAEYNTISRSPEMGGIGGSQPKGGGHGRGGRNQKGNQPPATPGQQPFNPATIY